MIQLARKIYGTLIGAIVCLIFLYFVAGYISLFLSVPPGYSAAVWPASGIALAALLLFGKRLWPGIFFGSFLVNIISNQQLQENIGTSSFILLSVSIAVGATLQALIASYLIKKQVDIRSGLLTAQSITRLLAIGGPLSCVISASFGISSLWFFGIVSASEFPYSWSVWWMGDSIGVLLILPISFILFGYPQSIWRQRSMSVALPIIATLITIVIIFTFSSRQENQNISLEFRERANILADSFEKNVIKNIEVFYSVQSLFVTSPSVSKEQFKQYVQLAMVRNSTIHAISWNPVVLESQKKKFLSFMQENGFPHFKIKQKNNSEQSSNLIDAGKHVIVSFIEPFEGNEKALGFDIYSDNIRRKAIEQAEQNHQVVATQPIQLIQEEGNQFGVLFLFPVLTNGQIVATDHQDNNISGYIVGVLRMGQLLSEILEKSPLDNVNVSITDISDNSNPLPLASSSISQGILKEFIPQRQLDSIRLNKTFRFANRDWQFTIDANSDYLINHRSWVAWAVLTGGFLFSSLLGAFLLILSGHSIIDKKRSDELTNEINSRKEYEKKLELLNKKLGRLATTDPLTQLNNRRSITEIGAKLDSEHKRYSGSYSVMMIDIDKFKQVNDRWGHDIGDKVIKEVANRINERLRESDHLARWGGEEFLVIAPHSSNKASLEQAIRICKEVNSIPIDPVGVVSISVGVSTYEKGTSFDELIVLADNALYEAKKAGRNRVISSKLT